MHWQRQEQPRFAGTERNPPLPGSKQTQSDPYCGDHSLQTKQSVSSFPQPCLTSLPQSLAWLPPASLPWLCNLRWSKNQSLSHQKYVTFLTRKVTEVFPPQRAPFPPQPPRPFPTSSRRVNQCQGGYPAKATNGTFNSEFPQNFPAGNKSQQNIAFATRGLSG